MISLKIFGIKSIEFTAISTLAMEGYGCVGALESEMEEQEVDQLLGEKSFCGGEVPEDVLCIINDKEMIDPVFYFEKDLDAREFLKEAESNLNRNFLFALEAMPEKDWNLEWKKFYSTIKVTSNFSIIPSWEKAPTDGEYILIEPGLGFGSGTHPTSFGCIKEIVTNFEAYKNNKRVLDFGCGSGILGIAALKLFASEVDFVDIDKDALENCSRNIKINETSANKNFNYSVINRDQYSFKEYDLVFANILLNILILESDTILKSVRNNGIIIFSGILSDQVEELIAYYRSRVSFKIISNEIIENWATISILVTK